MVHSWTAAEARAQCEAAQYNRYLRLASGDELTFADVGDPQARLTVSMDPRPTCTIRRCGCCSPCMPTQMRIGMELDSSHVQHELTCMVDVGRRTLESSPTRVRVSRCCGSGASAGTATWHSCCTGRPWRALRVLCIDRPGQGGSTASPADARVLDWPGQLPAPPACHAAQQTSSRYPRSTMGCILSIWQHENWPYAGEGSRRIRLLCQPSPVYRLPASQSALHAARPRLCSHCLLAALIMELADQLGLEQFSLVGQSCGAVFAMACALPGQPTCRESLQRPRRSHAVYWL